MNKKLKKALVVCMVVVAFSALCVVGASAASESGAVANEAVSAVQSALSEVTGEITLSSVLSVIGIGLGASVGFFFMWFGIRWVIRKVTKAIKSGRLG